MPAALLGFVEKMGPILATAKNRLGRGDSVTAIVRGLRFLYIATLGIIFTAWYAGWRRQVVDEGKEKIQWPVPGVTKLKRQRSLAQADAQGEVFTDASSILTKAGTIAFDVGAATGNPAVAAAGAVASIAGDISGKAGIIALGHLGQRLGLHVGENPAFGGVHPVHAKNSLHYLGRAIDVSAPMNAAGIKKMDAFANMLVAQYGIAAFTELIWNGPHPVSIKNGKSVPPSFWGSETWAGHKDHVHIGI